MLSNLYYDVRNLEEIDKANTFIPHGITIASVEDTEFYIKKDFLLRQIGFHQFYSMKNYLVAKICLENALTFYDKNPLQDK